MMPEQQQRILGYFIEEAKDHLNTIEQGLLNLQSTIQDPEMVTEVFRAAHSVKGGAAMLSLGSIQQISHRLEDYFKILKETPTTQIDRDLETMFLQVFDGLQALLEELQGPFGLTADKAKEVMADTEPVFGRLESHLNKLVAVAPATAPPVAPVATAAAQSATRTVASSSEDSALKLVFSSDVPGHLREMLTLFKQADTATSRAALQACCDALKRVGEQFDLSLWCDLTSATRQVVGNPEQTYRSMAPVVIKELKRAQEQVLSGQANAIAISAELESLLPAVLETDAAVADIDALLDDALSTTEESDLTDLFAADTESATDVAADLDWLDLPDTATETPADDDLAASLSALTDDEIVSEAPREPTVGAAELNSLADLFEGEVAELDSPWEEISEREAAIADTPSPALDIDTDFSDLLEGSFEEDNTDSSNDLADLFGDTGEFAEETPAAVPVSDAQDDLDDLLNLEVTPSDAAASSADADDIGLDPLLDSFDTATASRDAATDNSLDLDFGETSEALDLELELEEPAAPAAGATDFGDLFGAEDAAEDLEDAAATDAIDLAEPPAPTTVDEPVPALDETAVENTFAAIDDPWSTSEGDTDTAATDDAESALDALDELWTETADPETSNEPTTAEQDFSDFPDLEVEVEASESLEADSAVETVDDFDDLFADPSEAATVTEPDFDLDDTSLALDDLAPTEDEDSAATDTDFDLLLDDSASEAITSEPELDDFNETPTATETGLDFLVNSDDDVAAVPSTAADDLFAATPSERDANDADFNEAVSAVNVDDVDALFDDDPTDTLADVATEVEQAAADDFDLTFADAGDEALSLASDSDAATLETPLFEEVVADTSDDLFAETDAGLTTVEEMPVADDDFFSGDESSASVLAIADETNDDIETPLVEEAVADPSDDLFAETDAGLTDAEELSAAVDDDFFSSADTSESAPAIASETSDDIDDFFATSTEATTIEATTSDLDEFADLGDSPTAELTDSEVTLQEFELASEDELNGENLASFLEADAGEPDILDQAADLDLLDLDDSLLTDDSADLDRSAPDATVSDTAVDGLFAAVSENDENPELDELDFDLSDAGATSEATTENAALEISDPNAELELDELDFGLSDVGETADAAPAIAEVNDDTDSFGDLDAMLSDTTADTSVVDAFETSEGADSFDDLDSLLSDTTADTSMVDAGDSSGGEDSADSFDDLDAMLSDTTADTPMVDAVTSGGEDSTDSFDDLDAMLNDTTADAAVVGVADTGNSDFDELDALLDSEPPAAENIATDSNDVGFDELDALIGEEDSVSEAANADDIGQDEFGDLEKLLEEADQTLGGGASSLRSSRPNRSSRRVGGIVDQTMRVSVKHLDNLNNLVGELVVNRNSLEQDQDRFRQFLDNLLFQVQQLNDVGQRMRDLYERSLLESSLLASRQAFQTGGSRLSTTANGSNGDGHATGASFDALEMDRFTGFHTLTQEMIELIVRVRESSSDIAYTVESTDQIARQFRQVTTQLQEGLNKARMVPFAQTADRLPRAVRDISIKCGKEARLVVEGRDTLIDKMLLERLYDPMTHLVNNAITHGIESPEERAALGKSREGKITVRAFYQGNQTVIYIEDDGAGINPDLLKRKAIQKGLITQAEAERMNKLETYELIFHHGFTTREQADDFAGRGVGMDVVRTALSEIRGSINIDSELGKGTSFTIRLPLTLSISKALSCLNNQARIAFPMDGVEDMFDVPRERVQTNDNDQSYIQWRDIPLTFQPLSDLLQFNRALGRGRVYGGSQDDDMVSIVVLRNANTYIGIQVDRVLGEQEIVIKQIEGPVPKPMGIAGATVLGDGRVMPIGDVLELIDIAQGRVRREAGSSLWSQVELPPEEEVPVKSEPTVLIVDDSITVRELLSMSFNKVGYRVEQARDGQEAWEKMRSGLPCDLVFCDIEMPRMDGLELLSRMQKDGMLKNIPIAMLTSRGADRHRQMAVDLGASGYFTKPYLEEALLEAAQKMLQGEVLIGAVAEEAE